MSGPELKGTAACAAGAARATGQGAFGLVLTPTSDQPTLIIDRFASRYRRLKHSVITTARLLQESKQKQGHRHYLVMLTLTYGPDRDWQERHISDLQKNIRRYLKGKGKTYDFVWVCELQERGAPHYHILILMPHGVRLPKPDKNRWWPHGSTRIEKVEKAIGYLTKYLTKGQDSIHKFMKGQRTHGSGGLTKEAQMERRWWMAPKFVRDKWPNFSLDVRRAEGGGWMSRETGEWMQSQWEFVTFSGKYGAVLRRIAGPSIGVFAK